MLSLHEFAGLFLNIWDKLRMPDLKMDISITWGTVREWIVILDDSPKAQWKVRWRETCLLPQSQEAPWRRCLMGESWRRWYQGVKDPWGTQCHKTENCDWTSWTWTFCVSWKSGQAKVALRVRGLAHWVKVLAANTDQPEFNTYARKKRSNSWKLPSYDPNT